MAVSLSPRFLNGGIGILLGGLGLLAAVLAKEVLAFIGWVACYGAVVTLSWTLEIDGEPWILHLWRKGWRTKALLAAVLTAPLLAITWFMWPRPYVVAYQLCYRNIPVVLPDGSPGSAGFDFGLRLLTTSKKPIYFQGISQSFSLGDAPVDNHRLTGEPPLAVTWDTRKVLTGVTSGVDFIPPKRTPLMLEGEYHYSLRYGKEETGPFPETLEVGGPVSVSVATDGKGVVVGLGRYPGSDPRMVYRDCYLTQKGQKRPVVRLAPNL